MERGALIRSTAIGTVLQLVMVITGHRVESMKSAFLVGGLLFSAIAGGLYAYLARNGSLPSKMAAALVAGGACAFVGILASYLMGDVPAGVLAFGTISSGVTGLLGAVVIHGLQR